MTMDQFIVAADDILNGTDATAVLEASHEPGYVGLLKAKIREERQRLPSQTPR